MQLRDQPCAFGLVTVLTCRPAKCNVSNRTVSCLSFSLSLSRSLSLSLLHPHTMSAALEQERDELARKLQALKSEGGGKTETGTSVGRLGVMCCTVVFVVFVCLFVCFVCFAGKTD